MPSTPPNAEQLRLQEAREHKAPWKKWGPYLSERQWGTVREDYSDNGAAWDYFPHDHARSRAYRWGEDGLAGFSDERQRLCFALALWNGKDPILKERLFGLSNSEGNHGEDVKECYFYLDSTPTHSYMKYLYKYPQAAYPYDDLVRTNHERTRMLPEYELLDTGVFDADRYFDVFVEYAKQDAEDILIRITACNRGPDAAQLQVLPHLWFRNIWSQAQQPIVPTLSAMHGGGNVTLAEASHRELGDWLFYCDGDVPLLFTSNETNRARLFQTSNPSRYVKDAFHRYIIDGQMDAINPAGTGTKMAAQYKIIVPARDKRVIRLRLTRASLANHMGAPFSSNYDAIFSLRLNEADEFYQSITPGAATDDERNVYRQALAGMLWSKQYYCFDLETWLAEHGHDPLHGIRHPGTRNANWFHMLNDDVISMPDKWEYPWYAAWDLAFHTIALNEVDPDFAKSQLLMLLREVYLHPNGQIPAYEWNFGDVNPPVQAFAALAMYASDRQTFGAGDKAFLKMVFQKLLLNFSWWANRKDPQGRNLFEGGFLGLDNIGVFDRSRPLPTGGYLEQADGTAWMALYCQNMLEIALELAIDDPTFEPMALKFMEHFLWIAGSMDRIGENQDELWDEEDGFFYDLLHLPDGTAGRLKVRSMVGLLPLCATSLISHEQIEKLPRLRQKVAQFVQKHPELVANIFPPDRAGRNGQYLLSLLNEEKLRRILARMVDESWFLSPHGIRSLARYHMENPYKFDVHGEEYVVQYQPAESQTGLFGGNSNWRGPVWFPINVLIIRALLQFYRYFGDDFRIECPTGSGRTMTLYEVAMELSRRLTSTFLKDANGRRPVYGATEKFQRDPLWRDYVLFFEYFHGDNGAGLGASHQTGWTGTVARLMQMTYGRPQHFLNRNSGKSAAGSSLGG
jgi:hypothetical protein